MHICKMIYEIFEDQKIELITSLPCNKFQDLLGNLPEQFKHIHLTREENGVGISTGFHLTFGKPVMLIQSTGLGNSINALASLHKSYRLPLPILATWRGRDNDLFAGQIPLGKSLPGIFEALSIPYEIIEKPNQIDKIDKVINTAFKENTPYIILICPEIWEANEDKFQTPKSKTRKRKVKFYFEREFSEPQLTRKQAIETLKFVFKDDIVISTIGNTCDELYQVCDRDLNFYVMGAMGQASAIGLGMSINTNKKVFVLDGDGSLLMNPNILCEISTTKPSNLIIVALDNGIYSTTGGQKTHAYDNIDLELLAQSFGIINTKKAYNENDILNSLDLFQKGPSFLHIPIKIGKSEGNNPLNPIDVKKRFTNVLNQTKKLN